MSNCSYFLGAYISKTPYIVLTLMLLFTLVFYYLQKREKTLWEYIGLLLILIGASFNLGARILHNCVVDNLSFFGVLFFNFYDILVVLGIIVLVGEIFYESYRINNRR